MNANRLYPLLADRTKGFVYVCRTCDPDKAAALAAKHVTGLYSYPEERRRYPQSSVAAQVLGYAGIDNHGLAGLELQLDKQLSGKPGTQTVIKTPDGRPIDVISSTPVREGKSVALTIDHTIQAQAEMVPFIQRVGPHFLSPLGPLNSFVLLEVRDEKASRIYRYRAIFKDSSLLWTFTLTKEGKISSLQPTEE